MIDWSDQERIRTAIVTLHVEARYYDGLDILCKLVGWGSFRCEGGFYPESEMAAWVKSNGGGSRREAAIEPAPSASEESALDVLQSAQIEARSSEEPVRSKRGWPKGKPRGPRRLSQ